MTNRDNVVISLQNVSVAYKRRGGLIHKKRYAKVLSDISFDIYEGEILGIVGRNGAGKSTLLKTIAGIIKPDTGIVNNYGFTVNLLALQAGFDSELSGRDNAVINGMLIGNTKGQVEAKLDDIKQFSELGASFHEPVKTYSSGMRSRLGFSVAISLLPKVILLDEVLSVGDKHFRDKAEKEILKKALFEDVTIVLVSHSEAQLNRVADRVIKL